jgi:hypothetical protein
MTIRVPSDASELRTSTPAGLLDNGLMRRNLSRSPQRVEQNRPPSQFGLPTGAPRKPSGGSCA